MAFVLLFSLYAIAGAPTATAPTITSLAQFSKGLSPAQRAGLQPGDTIVAIDGHKNPSLDSLISFVNKHSGDRSDPRCRPGRARPHAAGHSGRRPPRGRGDRRRAHPGRRPSGPATGIIGVELTDARDVTVGPVTGRRASRHRARSSIVGQTFSGLATIFSLHGLGNFAHQVATAGNSKTSSSSSSSSSASASSPRSSPSSGRPDRCPGTAQGRPPAPLPAGGDQPLRRAS